MSKEDNEVLWLDQFNEHADDHKQAKSLRDKVKYISNSDLKFLLHLQLDQLRFKATPSALFVERELPKTRGKLPPRMYAEEKRKIPGRKIHARRATGAAIQAVKSLSYKRQEIGSKGIIAQILSRQCKKFTNDFILQPTADEIRASKVRALVIVTDFIGSGERALTMLSSLWRVRSIRSWASYKFIKLFVVCVSGTERGIENIERHPSKPTVIKAFPCPTIWSSFSSAEAAAMKDLCKRYGSFDEQPLGHKETGALIAFEHSAPNNMPAIFIKSCQLKSRPWTPLFSKRSTEHLWHIYENMENAVKESFSTIELSSILLNKKYKWAQLVVQHAILITAISSKGYSNTDDQIQYSGISLRCFELARLHAVKERWITPLGQITKKGRDLVKDLSSNAPVEISRAPYYYPQQLRAPL